MTGTIPSPGDTAMKKTDKIPVLTGLSFSGGSQTITKCGYYRLW